MTSGLERRRRPTSSSRRPASCATARGPLASAELFVIIDLPEAIDAHARQRADARHRADDAPGPRRSAASSRGGCCSSAPTRSSSGRAATRQFAGLSSASQVKSGQITWTVVGIFESGGTRGRDRDLVRRAHAAGRLPPRQQLPVGAGRGSSRRTSSTAFKDWLTANPQAQRVGRPRDRVLRGAVDDADDAHPDGRVRHRDR